MPSTLTRVRSLVLVAGPSGSGKSRLINSAGDRVARVSLDDFYRDHDYPSMPQSYGITDWDHVDSWDSELALHTLRKLVEFGTATVPVYDISQSRRVGERTIDARSARLIVAEGIFATQTCKAAREAGLAVEAIWLDRPRINNFTRRLTRDLKESRKPPAILLRRGIALYRNEVGLKKTALTAGFSPMGMRQAQRHIFSLITAH